MIYEVTYKDSNGDPLMVATFNAENPKEGLQILASTPSLEPPAGTEIIEIVQVDPA